MFEIKRQPAHPGAVLREDFIAPIGITQRELADRLKTTFRTVNEILNEKRGVSPDMALRLARFFGTSEELWLNLQDQYDLYRAKEKGRDVLREIKPYRKVLKA